MAYIELDTIQTFANGCLKAAKAEDVAVPLTRLLDDVGLKSWYVGSLVHDSELKKAGFGFFGMAPGWRERYAEERHNETDPVFNYARTNDRALTWFECQKQLRAAPSEEATRALRVFHEARAFGLNDGFIKPVHATGEIPAAVTFGGAQVNRSPQALACLEMVAAWAFEGFRRVAESFKPIAPYLTPRELEVLRWTAEGKSAWQIGEIMKLAECTVRDHQKSIRQKYGVSTLIRAVVLAAFDRTLTFAPSTP